MSVSNSLAAILLAAAPPASADPMPADVPAAPLPVATQEAPPTSTPAAAAVTTAETTPAASAPPAPPPPPLPAGNEDDIIVVQARKEIPGDPLSGVNATTYGAVQAVDDAIIAPVAEGYTKAVPNPVRTGLHNLLNNLDEPVVFLNFLIQLKPGKALETLGRFAINSTLGIGGVMDVAKKKPFNLPRRFNGLADTLGYYGVGPGPYLYLPLIGSTTLRDGLARIVDLMVLPAGVGKPFTDPTVTLAKGALSSLDDRVEMDPQIRRVQESADPYVAQRDAYLKRRQAEIDVLRGKLPLSALDGSFGLTTHAAPPPAVAQPPAAPAPQADPEVPQAPILQPPIPQP